MAVVKKNWNLTVLNCVQTFKNYIHTHIYIETINDIDKMLERLHNVKEHN